MAQAKHELDDLLMRIPGAGRDELSQIVDRLKAMLPSGGDVWAVHHALGAAYHRLRVLTDGDEAYRLRRMAFEQSELAWRLRPDQAFLFANLILQAGDLLSVVEKVSYFAEVVERHPYLDTHPAILAAMALVLVDAGMVEEAETYFEDALEHLVRTDDLTDNNWLRLHDQLVEVALLLNEVDAAEELAARYICIASGTPMGTESAQRIVVQSDWSIALPDGRPEWLFVVRERAVDAMVAELDEEELQSDAPSDTVIPLFRSLSPLRQRATTLALVSNG